MLVVIIVLVKVREAGFNEADVVFGDIVPTKCWWVLKLYERTKGKFWT
jgi:hypothetical protein